MSDLKRTPVFVVGGGRSGTSIMLRALGVFDEIVAAPGETPLLTTVGDVAWHHFCLTDRIGDYYRNALKIKRNKLECLLIHLGFRFGFGTVFPLIAVLKCKYTVGRPTKLLRVRRWAAKTSPKEKHAQGLKAIFPGCQIICMVRNGIDVVGSRMKYKGFSSLPFEEHCMNWRDTVSKYAYVDRLDWGIVIRYEDFLSDQASTLSKIADFLGCHGNYDGVVHYVKTNVLHPLDKSDQSVSDAAAFLNSRNACWHSWNEEQRRTFIDICGSDMKSKGYKIPFL